jgi:hypothetical protein
MPRDSSALDRVVSQLPVFLSTDAHWTKVLKLIELVRLEVGSYYLSVSVVNLGLGLATIEDQVKQPWEIGRELALEQFLCACQGARVLPRQ